MRKFVTIPQAQDDSKKLAGAAGRANRKSGTSGYGAISTSRAGTNTSYKAISINTTAYIMSLCQKKYEK